MLIEVEAAMADLGSTQEVHTKHADTQSAWIIQSEKIAAGLQIALVVLLLGIFLTAPAPADRESTGLSPTLAALIGLLATSSIRFFAVQYVIQHRLQEVVLLAFEVLLFYLLIFSFHLLYDLALGAVLKAPTVFYGYFLVIIRAISLRPFIVGWAGILFVTGWGSLLMIAIWLDGAATERTRSFSEYLTTDKMLIGAEIDKTLALSAFSIAIYVLVSRAAKFFEIKSN